MSKNNWKAPERAIAELLGGKRVPVTGRQRGDVPDMYSYTYPWLSVEIKHRKNFPPQWIDDALDQAYEACKNDSAMKCPVAIWHGKGEMYLDSIVMLTLEDFIWILENNVGLDL